MLIARAVDNCIPLVAADVAGSQGERVCHGTTAIIDGHGTIVAAAEPLREDFIVADVAIDAGAGRLDGQVDARANPAVTEQFRALWR